MIKALIVTMFLLIGLIAVPAVAGAADILNVDCSGDRAQSAVCSDQRNHNPIAGPNGLIIKIADVIAFIAGAAAIIMLIYAGLSYITSGGDPGNARKARDAVLFTLLGIAFIAVARALVVFVVAKL